MDQNFFKKQQSDCGNFYTHANLSQAFKAIFKQHYEAIHPTTPIPNFVAEAASAILYNLASIANGNPYNPNAWQNIIGYSELALELVETAQSTPVTADVSKNVTKLDTPKIKGK